MRVRPEADAGEDEERDRERYRRGQTRDCASFVNGNRMHLLESETACWQFSTKNGRSPSGEYCVWSLM
ncbi:hypothetical protein chiPu_0013607 [Chiloscyllium punctatum]|uniref:Uncharacterized protein n=1 Tax=Chiloscyllium punctatum TaxID=137246 RepID=A0A401SXS9_CHIPU|nr:hypothetical protein [Chiloscyllium punctatum]